MDKVDRAFGPAAVHGEAGSLVLVVVLPAEDGAAGGVCPAAWLRRRPGRRPLDPAVRLILCDGALVELAVWRHCAERFVGPDQAEAFGDHPDDLADALAKAADDRWQPYWDGTDPDPADHGGQRTQRPAMARPRPGWWFHLAWWVTILVVVVLTYRLVQG